MTTVVARVAPLPLVRSRGWRLVERNALVARRSWPVFLSGFFEPVFYLLSIGSACPGWSASSR